jgi:hypothetical protein
MKRREVISRVKVAADVAGLNWEVARQGAKHEVWILDDLSVTIPRHREINEHTADGIFRACEPKLGERWWRK